MILYLTKISIFFSLKKEFWLCIMQNILGLMKCIVLFR